MYAIKHHAREITAKNGFFVHPDQHNGQNRGCGVSNRDLDNGRCSSTVVLVSCRSGRVSSTRDQHNGQNRGLWQFQTVTSITADAAPRLCLFRVGVVV